MEQPKWVKDKTLHKDFEVIECKHHNDCKIDAGCYVLIKVDFEHYEVQVAICNHQHEIMKVFKGKSASDIYNTIFQYEKEHNFNWFTDKSHIAYLGKELKKAEIALAMGNNAYFQE